MYVLGHWFGYSHKASITALLSDGSTKADAQISGTQAGFGALDLGSRPPGFTGCLIQGRHHNTDEENDGWWLWKKISDSTDNDNGIVFRNVCFCFTRWRRTMWQSIILLLNGPCFLYLDGRCSIIYQTGIETISITWYREADSYMNSSTNNQNPLVSFIFFTKKFLRFFKVQPFQERIQLRWIGEVFRKQNSKDRIWLFRFKRSAPFYFCGSFGLVFWESDLNSSRLCIQSDCFYSWSKLKSRDM
jgi:hypothetical protein